MPKFYAINEVHVEKFDIVFKQGIQILFIFIPYEHYKVSRAFLNSVLEKAGLVLILYTVHGWRCMLFSRSIIYRKKMSDF